MKQGLLRDKKRRESHNPCGDPDLVRQKLIHWYDDGIGQYLADAENKQLQEALSTIFGFYCLQLGYIKHTDYFSACPIRHQIVIDIGGESTDEFPIDIYANLPVLPIASDSVDLVLLPHTLEMNANPHQILRETDRVLISEGHVVVLGFNPWSLWGVRHMLSRHSGEMPWCARFLSLMRLKDWLKLLGFDVVYAKTFFFRLPFFTERKIKLPRTIKQAVPKVWPAFGGAYILVAQKRTLTLTPIKPRWRRRRTFLRPGLVET